MEIKESLIRFIKGGIALVFLTPLVMGPFGLNMSEYPKAVFFRSVIEIIFVLYICLILINRSYVPKKSFILFSIIGFDIILIIASIFGINFYRSFFGEMQRGEGIITHLHLLAFFVILIGLFRKREDWLRLLKISVIVCALTNFAAILQQLRIFKFYNVEMPRLSGTLSNPDLFGAYLTLSIFLAIFVWISEKKKNWKILWASLIALNLYTLFCSGTKGAWIGFIFGVISIYLLNYKSLDQKKRIFSLLIVLFVFVCALFLPTIIVKSHLDKTTFGSRILRVYSLNIDSNRTNLWKSSVIAFEDKPVLGWGFESYSFVYDKYFETGDASGVYFDRPHNKVIEVFIYGGLIGMIGYLLIFFALFYCIFKYAKLWDGYNDNKGILFSSVIFAFFLSGFIQNIVSFDNIVTYILFFLVAGFVNNNYSNLRNANTEKPDKPLTVEKIIFISSVFVLMGFVMFQVNIKPTVAAIKFPESVVFESSDPTRALDSYKNGAGMNTIYDNDLMLAYAERSIFILEQSMGQNVGEIAVEGLQEVKPLLYEDIAKKDERPSNLYEFIIRSDEWSYIVRKSQNYLDDMDKDVNQAIAFNKNVPVFYQLRGEMEILQNKNDAGENDIKKSVEMTGGNEASAYRSAGIAYFKKGDFRTGISSFQKALDVDYAAKKNGLPSMIQNVDTFIDSEAIMYYNYLKDFENSKKVYERGIEVYPEYQSIFQYHLDMITADYEKNKSSQK